MQTDTKHRRFFAAGLLLLLTGAVLFSFGCESYVRCQRRKQLERVAKDWCYMIRASQVIPIYPTTEDIYPGDLFLVTKTVENQHEAFLGDDFLELDHHLDRIHPTGYDEFYKRSFTVKNEDMPKIWLEPTSNEKAWKAAPMAYFPTYSFSTSASLGANAAFPIQGVPVGLSLLNSGKATATVQIKDARTYGVDQVSLYRDIQKWERDNDDVLRQYETRPGEPPCYLRVVSRVYLAREMMVNLQDSSAISASTSAGVPKPVDLLLPVTGEGNEGVDRAAGENYEKQLENLNTAIAKALGTELVQGGEGLLPGGTVKVVSASSGSITLNEKFKRPVVIGYLGFDMLIGPYGILGPPIPTLAVVSQHVEPVLGQAAAISRLYKLSALSMAYGRLIKLAKEGDRNAQAIQKGLQEMAKRALPDPAEFQSDIFQYDTNAELPEQKIKKGTAIDSADDDFNRLVVYQGKILRSIENLRQSKGLYYKDVTKWIAANEAELAQVDRVLMRYTDLLQKLRLY